MAQGLFITVEGIEGVGKSTNIQVIKDWCSLHGVKVITTREPGGTPLAESIRDLLLAKRDETVHYKTELLLMLAARTQHYYQHILPHIEQGFTVICDRFSDSTYAYQGGGRGISEDMIYQLESCCLSGVKPDLTVLLDAPVELGLQRAKNRSVQDRFESETLEFFNRVRESFLRRAKEDENRVQIVNASLSLDNVEQQIQRILEVRLAECINNAS